MLSITLNSNLTYKIKELDNLIALKYEELKILVQDEREALHGMTRVSQIGASTRIENAVLTDAEVNWVDTVLSASDRPTVFQEERLRIDDKLSKDKERSIEEVAGCRNMLVLIYGQGRELFPLTETSLRGLHQELLRFYPPASRYAGTYKTVTNSVVEKNHRTGEERIVFKTADPGPITEAAMADLVRWFNETLKENPWTVAVACELVFRFLAIHPFQDGNGRLGRGLFLLTLLQSPDPKLAAIARYLTIDRQIERHRQEYYSVLQRCSGGVFHQNPQEYRMDYFLDYMVRMMREALENLDACRRRYRTLQDLSPAASQVFECFKDNPEKTLQTRDIVRLTSLPRRTVNSAIVTLQQGALIQTKGRGRGTRHQVVW
jgi:Fic family protein